MGEKAAAQQQQRFHELSLANLTKYHRALNDLALGVWYEGCGKCQKPLDGCQCGKPGEVRIYQRLPDRLALEALIEQAVGKAVQKSANVTDTEIVISHEVPRPGKVKAAVEIEEIEDGEGETDAEGDVDNGRAGLDD